MFSNENLCKAQQKKENDTSNNDESISNNVLETPDTSPKGRYPRAKEMHSDTYVHLKDPLCIICNVAKCDWETRKKVPTMMID